MLTTIQYYKCSCQISSTTIITVYMDEHTVCLSLKKVATSICSSHNVPKTLAGGFGWGSCQHNPWSIRYPSQAQICPGPPVCVFSPLRRSWLGWRLVSLDLMTPAQSWIPTSKFLALKAAVCSFSRKSGIPVRRKEKVSLLSSRQNGNTQSIKYTMSFCHC